MSDIYSAPAEKAAAVTASDATVVNFRSLYVGTGGNLAVTMAGGGDVIFPAVPSGAVMPIRVSKVLATNTTASNIVGLA